MDASYSTSNVNEDIVGYYIDECMSNAGVCTCDRCRADVTAYALNLLPPRYVVTTKGYVYTTMQAKVMQNQADVLSAIMKGIQKVQEQPNHNE